MTAFYACVTILPATDRELFLTAWKRASLECVKLSICFLSCQSGGVTCAPFFFLLQLPPLYTTARQGLRALQGWWKLLVCLFISMIEWFTGWPQRHFWKAGEELLVFVTISVICRLLCKINHTGGEKESNGLLNLPLYIKNIEHKREQLAFSFLTSQV